MDDGALREVVGQIARKHGVLLDAKDPMCLVPSLVALGFEEALRRQQARAQDELSGGEKEELGGREPLSVVVPSASPSPEVTTRLHAEVGPIVELLRAGMREELDAHREKVRRDYEAVRDAIIQEVRRADGAAATLVANVDHAHTRPARIRWATIGMVVLGLATWGALVVGKHLR